MCPIHRLKVVRLGVSPMTDEGHTRTHRMEIDDQVHGFFRHQPPPHFCSWVGPNCIRVHPPGWFPICYPLNVPLFPLVRVRRVLEPKHRKLSRSTAYHLIMIYPIWQQGQSRNSLLEISPEVGVPIGQCFVEYLNIGRGIVKLVKIVVRCNLVGLGHFPVSNRDPNLSLNHVDLWSRSTDRYIWTGVILSWASAC